MCFPFPLGEASLKKKSLPSNARVRGSIPGQGTKIPPAAEQLSPRATTRVHVAHRKILCATTDPTRPKQISKIKNKQKKEVTYPDTDDVDSVWGQETHRTLSLLVKVKPEHPKRLRPSFVFE